LSALRFEIEDFARLGRGKAMTSVPIETKRDDGWNSDVSKLCSLATLVEAKLGHEVTLLGHRMEWLGVSESFLFGAFAVVLTSGTKETVPAHLRFVMLILLLSIGIALAVVVFFSLRAALTVSRALRTPRGIIEERLKTVTGIRELPNLGNEDTREKSLRWTLEWGSATAKWVPLLIVAIWVLVLFLIVLPVRA
jgi:hypothetical protein